MGNRAENLHFSREDYLQWEAKQQDKHEYLAGELFAMTGVRQIHSIVALNIASELKQQLKGKPCRPHLSDMKLMIEEIDAFFYPDIMVSCDLRDKKADLYLQHPKLIIEVLSASTASYDMGLKFEYYRLIPEFEEYLLVDPEIEKLWLYRKKNQKEWLLHELNGAEEILFESIGCKISKEDIFDGL